MNISINTNNFTSFNPPVARESDTGLSPKVYGNISDDITAKEKTTELFEEMREAYIEKNLEEFDKEDDDKKKTPLSTARQTDSSGAPLTNPVNNNIPLPIDPFKNISRMENSDKINRGEGQNNEKTVVNKELEEALLPKNNSLIKLKLFAYESQMINKIEESSISFTG